MQIETGSYQDFSRSVHTGAARLPINGTIEISHRCPLNCAHCYNNLPMGDVDARRREMTTADHFRLLDQMAEAGCLWLLYTGGEIFARRDFLDIYTYAKRTGFIVTLFTNGTLITPEIADYLVEWRPFEIEITLYGATRETYEKLTRIPGSYDRCMRGVRLLHERKVPLKLKTVGVTINKHEVAAMRQIADDFGVEFMFDSMMNPRIDCSASPLEVRLAPHEVVELDLLDPRRVAEWTRLATNHAPPPASERVLELYDCGGGLNSFSIDPYGDISICVLSHVDRYNVVSGSFREGWDFLANVHSKPVTRLTKCTDCALRSLCGMCAANGELENGDPLAPVDWLCRVAHLRAMTYDIAIRPHGDCEYCADGERHEMLRMTAHALRNGGMAQLEAAAQVVPEPNKLSCGSGCPSCTIH
jgi:radical SAM protein with 4Fe4S-binding SPASM domain